MKRAFIIAALFATGVSPAFAQQPPMDPIARALATKLDEEFRSGVQCLADKNSLVDQLQAAQAQVKELEAEVAKLKAAAKK